MSSGYVKTYEEVLVYPAVDDWQGGVHVHGLASNDGDLAPEDSGFFKFGASGANQSLRRNIDVNEVPERVSGTYLYLGAAAPHFGHFLMESIVRYWAIKDYLPKCDGVVILPHKLSQSKKFVDEVFKIFGFEGVSVRYIEKYSIVERMLVPEQGRNAGDFCKPFYKDYLEGYNPPSKWVRAGYPKKVLVSRRGFKYVGRLAGFDAVSKSLIDDGYYEFQPERYSIQQQLAVVCSADEVVWEEGSALHLLELLPYVDSKNILFCRRPRSLYSYFIDLLRDKCKNASIFSLVEMVEGSEHLHNRMSKVVDFDSLRVFLIENIGVSVDEDYFTLAQNFDLACNLIRHAD